jgi:uncharacterized damage-inducible protein DinB
VCPVTTLRQQDRRIGSWGPGECQRQVDEHEAENSNGVRADRVDRARECAIRAAQAPSLQANLLADWINQKDRLMKLANVMPREQFAFKPIAAQPNYAEQILHLAEANVIQLGRLPKLKAPSISMRATSKAEVVKALEDSFDDGMAALEEQTDQTLLQPAETTRFDRFMGPSTRARAIWYVMGHTEDIYGQMVVYVRLNGVTPPASQRP